MSIKANKVLLTLILFFFTMSSFVEARGLFYQLHSNERIVGTIKDFGRNTIELFDEQEKRIKKFIYLGDRSALKIEDRVCIYYEPNSKIVSSIKKMTSLKYQKEGQNLGYIFQENN